jgi:hypothetical protein
VWTNELAPSSLVHFYRSRFRFHARNYYRVRGVASLLTIEIYQNYLCFFFFFFFCYYASARYKNYYITLLRRRVLFLFFCSSSKKVYFRPSYVHPRSSPTLIVVVCAFSFATAISSIMCALSLATDISTRRRSRCSFVCAPLTAIDTLASSPAKTFTNAKQLLGNFNL